MKHNLLYIHNDPDHQINIEWIEKRNINVFTASTFDTACDLFRSSAIHIVLLDMDLQEQDSISFIRCLRDKGLLTPVIMSISTLDQNILLESINLNNVQCLIKPYPEQGLCDALKIATNKADICHPLTYTDLNFGYTYDPIDKKIISSDGAITKLCQKEAALIELLLRNGENITSYEIIENIVWKDSFMSVESLRTLIRGIRQKTHKDIITNHNGIGYQINIPS